jgi:hypothetical protein
MIDLDAAAAELGESLDHVHPDVDRVRARAGRRQRTRRIAAGVAALVLLAGGAAAASTIVGDQDDRDGVVTGPGPDGATDPDPEPTDPWSASQTIDVGDLRVRVPGDWRVIDAATDPSGGCGGPLAVVIGDPAPNVDCTTATELRVALLQEPLDGAGEDPQTVNGIALVRLAPDPTPVWAAPDLGVRLSFGKRADVAAILGTIGPSARQTALADATNGGVAGWQVDPATWQEVTYEGIAIQVPAGWPVTPGGAIESQVEPCLGWALTGPTAIVGATDIPCGEGDPWRPRDGAWLLPAEGAVDTGDGSWEELAPFDLGGDGLAPLVRVDATSTVLQIVVEPPEGAPVLLRVGLGMDGHVAGSILSSIRLADGRPASDEGPIVLPCGTVAVPDRSVLDLPEDLVVDPQPGMGGWAPGTSEGICAVHLTDPEDPASHVTFADGSLPYSLGEELSGEATRAAGVRWGTIEDGFGGEVSTAEGDTVYVLAYGLSEEGAALLFASLATANGS